MLKLLYSIQQAPSLSPGAEMAAFTFYSTADAGGNACSMVADLKHTEAMNWLRDKRPSPDDILFVAGHSYGGHRARRFVDDIKTTAGLDLTTSLLVVVDPIDWGRCHIAVAIDDFMKLWQPQEPCNQSDSTYAHSARRAIGYRQVKGLDLVVFPLPFPLLGYQLASTSFEPVPNRPPMLKDHMEIDEDFTIQDTIRATLLDMVRGNLAVTPGAATRNLIGDITIPLKIKVPSFAATGVSITAASLNGVPAANLASLAHVGDIAAFSSSDVSLQFPRTPTSGVVPLTMVPLTISGEYSYGRQFSFTFRVSIPAPVI
jgi:hypothetical protein